MDANLLDKSKCQYCSGVFERIFILKCNHVYCKDCISKLTCEKDGNGDHGDHSKGIFCHLPHCNYFTKHCDITTKINALAMCYSNLLGQQKPPTDKLKAIKLSQETQPDCKIESSDVPTSTEGQPPIGQFSYRSTNMNLSELSTSNNTTQKSSFKLKKYCEKITLIEDRIWCASPRNNCIDIYTLSGDLAQSIIFDGIDHPRAVHPLHNDLLLVAARNGLFTINKDGKVISKDLKGIFRDVHGCKYTIAALQKIKYSVSTEFVVHILESTIPVSLKGSIQLGNDALSVLVTDQHIFVSSGYYFGQNHNIAKYTLDGKTLVKSGRKSLSSEAEVGELKWPYLCASDSSGCLLIADHGHHRLQVFSGENCWAEVKDVDVQFPRDAAIVGKQLVVNSSFTKIEVFEI